jgi:chromosomal replication initiator protein
MKPDQIWQTALGELQLQLTGATYNTWLGRTTLLACEDGTYIIGVHNGYAKDWLENRLLSMVKRTLTSITGRSVEVRFVVWNKELDAGDGGPLLESPPPSPTAQSVTAPRPQSPCNHGLNLRYTFDTFVIGPSNRLAHAASLAVVEKPATAYNPLFLYGGVGLGKTHLLHAIGHAYRARNLEVLYTSSEQFTNDLINAIRMQTTEDFRNKYRTADILLIDDIQFIAGKESTQEEFFHTFNTLHINGKQIVMTSDRAPKALVTLEERLRSRCEWGLIADIQPPDLETRMAILRAKAESLPMPVPDAVIELIARQVQSNIRELEGALNRVIANSQLTSVPLTVETATATLADLLARPTSISVEEVIRLVAAFYGIDVAALCGQSRSKEMVKPRHVAMFLARDMAGASLPQIGTAMDGRDHTTIMHGVNKIAEEIEHDDGLRREVLTIRERLYRSERT